MIATWKKTHSLIAFAVLSFSHLSHQGVAAETSNHQSNSVIQIQEGFVDTQDALIYYKEFGHGAPLLMLHGGPGASHDYFLPHLVPLARRNRLVFIDERGSGKSSKLENTSLYTVENMVED